MVYIFSGDDQFESRSALNTLLDKYQNFDILRMDNKEADLDLINIFLKSNSLFGTKKVLVLNNLFSVNKSILVKIAKIINDSPDIDTIIWQDKKLTQENIKLFPKAVIKNFPLDNKLFICLNSIKPHNLKNFNPLYHQVIKQGLYDLFLYLLKNNLRKQLTTFTRFDKQTLKTVYLQLIEVDYQNKTGQLVIPKELALERIIVNLIK